MKPIQLNYLTSRNSDPATSKEAGKRIAIRAGSQRALILAAYFYYRELTDYEAGQVTSFGDPLKFPNCCYWKRCSELRQAGFIEPTGHTRLSPAGQYQQVCRITEAGIKVVAEILRKEAEDEQNNPR